MSFKALSGLSALLLLVLAQGCGTTQYGGGYGGPTGGAVRNGVAVLGVINQPGVSSTLSEASLNNMMHDTIRESGKFASLSADKVNQVIGDERYLGLVKSYAANGAVAPEDVQLLMAARLPVDYAIIGRIEENTDGVKPITREKLRNNAGELLNDRYREVHTSVRRVTLSATMINLRSGHAYWTRTYRAEPEAKATYTEYTGSSFAGSLAATMANTVANGIRKPTPPPAPGLKLTIQSLMREVARNMEPG